MRIIKSRRTVRCVFTNCTKGEIFEFAYGSFIIGDVVLIADDWLAVINGTYVRKLGGFKSSDTKQDEDDNEWEEHVQERRGGGPGINGGGGGK